MKTSFLVASCKALVFASLFALSAFGQAPPEAPLNPYMRSPSPGPEATESKKSESHKSAKKSSGHHNFSLTLSRRTAAKDVYMFRQNPPVLRNAGDMILMRRDNAPVAELQIVKIEKDPAVFMGQIVNAFGGATFKPGDSFSALAGKTSKLSHSKSTGVLDFGDAEEEKGPAKNAIAEARDAMTKTRSSSIPPKTARLVLPPLNSKSTASLPPGDLQAEPPPPPPEPLPEVQPILNPSATPSPSPAPSPTPINTYGGAMWKSREGFAPQPPVQYESGNSSRKQNSGTSSDVSASFSFSTGLGLVYSNYNEALFSLHNPVLPPYQMISLDLSLTGRYFFSPVFSMNLDFNITLLPVADNSAGSAARNYGADLEASVRVWAPSSDLRLKIVTGLAYRAVQVSGAAFGFGNIDELEIFPRLEFKLTPRDWIYVSLRYSPVLNGFDLSNNREFGLGLQWTRHLLSKQSLWFRVDYANLGCDPNAQATTTNQVAGTLGFTW